MMRHHNPFTAFLLSCAILAVVGLLDSFVDSFALVTPGPSRQKIQVPKSRLLSSKSSRKTDGFINDENSNTAATNNETDSTSSNTTRNKKEATTKGYQRIEEWNKETHDSKHVIRQLKQEKASWKKTFDNLESF